MSRVGSLELIETEIPRMRRYARTLTDSHDAADDLVQEALVRAVAKIELWEPGTNMRAWLFTIMHNVHVSRLRQMRRKPERRLDEVDLFRIPQPPAQLHAVRVREVREAFARLTEEHREVLHLVVIEGMSYEDAAEVLNCAVGTVRSRLSRARARLHRMLDGRAEVAPKSPSEGGGGEVVRLFEIA
jgi:RNA polymerase sigma-70 factor (ECF subfamily)